MYYKGLKFENKNKKRSKFLFGVNYVIFNVFFFYAFFEQEIYKKIVIFYLFIWKID